MTGSARDRAIDLVVDELDDAEVLGAGTEPTAARVVDRLLARPEVLRALAGEAGAACQLQPGTDLGAAAPDTPPADVAALLRSAADGRREYAAGAPDRTSAVLLAEASTLDTAARIAAGDYGPLYDLLPSWRWTEEMHKRVLTSTSGSTTTADVAALARCTEEQADAR